MMITPAASFSVPESLQYDLSWKGIKAGTALLEITNYGERFRITSQAQSAKWVSVFYTVDDRIESILLKSLTGTFLGHPVNYRLRIREGRHRRDKEIIFDHAAGKATYIDHLAKEQKDVEVPTSVFDPISGFYYLRTLNFTVGNPVYLTIFDSKKVWNVEVKILRKERISLPSGIFNTIVVQPLMKSEGIFNKKGDILIWLSDDSKHIPVKLETKVAIGSVIATLTGGRY
jgi:hypothetical protein